MIPLVQKPEIEFNLKKRIFTKENVLSHSVCDEIIQFNKDNVRQGESKYNHIFQVSFKACLLPLDHYVHSLLQPVWEEASEYIKTSVELVEPYEIKQYTPQDFFGRHTDNYSTLAKNIDRKITLSVQLSDDADYVGGELAIFNKSSTRTKGSVICFPSYFPHEVKQITSGERWSLISWAWGPDWQ
jgi:PKHD-type hydroxylase